MTTVLTQIFQSLLLCHKHSLKLFMLVKGHILRHLKKKKKRFNSIKNSLKFSLSSLGISVPISSVSSECLTM